MAGMWRELENGFHEGGELQFPLFCVGAVI